MLFSEAAAAAREMSGWQYRRDVGCCEGMLGVVRSEGSRECTRETVAVGQSGVGLGWAASVLVWPTPPPPLCATDRCYASG